MKTLVIRSSKYSSKFITPRNLCIWDIRRRRHIKFKDIAIQFGISTERAQQIYEKCKELTKGVYFIMRILTRTQYDAICDIVTEQKKRIEELEAELDKMRSQRDRLQQLIEEPIVITDIHTFANPNDVVSIDFPGSSREDK